MSSLNCQVESLESDTSILSGETPIDFAFIGIAALFPDTQWLDPLFPAPVSLSAGRYTLLVTYAGWQTDGEAVIDAFWVIPATACKRLDGPARTLALCHHVQTGEINWHEQEK